MGITTSCNFFKDHYTKQTSHIQTRKLDANKLEQQKVQKEHMKIIE